MTAAVPESSLTSDELLKLANFRRELADELDAALGNGLSAFTPDGKDIEGTAYPEDPVRLIGSSVGFVSARSYNVTGDGTTDDSANFRLAMAGAVSLGAKLQLGVGTIVVAQHASNAWCLDVPNGCSIEGVPGHTTIEVKAGVGDQVATLRLNDVHDVEIANIIVNGNWGNAVTTLASTMEGLALPQATIKAEDIEGFADFPSSGTFKVVIGAGNTQTITYTGKTADSFTGCTGGAGTLKAGMKCGILDSNTGINHPTQADPRNHGIMIRGGRRITLRNIMVRGAYGDSYWYGFAGTPVEDVQNPARDIVCINCHSWLSARHGFSISQSVDGISFRDCSSKVSWGLALDSEPQTNNQYARNVLFDHCYFGLHWNPGGSGIANLSCGVKGGNINGLLDANAVRNFRFVNGCVFEGSLSVSSASALTVRDCFFLCDFDHGATSGTSYAPFFADHVIDYIDVCGNTFYDRGKYTDGYADAGNPHYAAIVVQNYGDWQPANIRIDNNNIRVGNNLTGIKISSTGGFAGAAGGFQRSSAHTATAISSNTVQVTGAGWVTNSKASWNVYIGGVVAQVESNTSDTLTLSTRIPSGGAWNLPYGGNGTAQPTPALGTMTLTVPSGIVSITNNTVNCSNVGYGQGKYGVALFADRSGMRVIISGQKTINANGPSIYIDATNLTVNPLLSLSDCLAHDDQPVPTCTSVVHFKNGVQGWDKLIIRNLMKTGGVSKALTGITTGVWMEEDGEMQRWAGWGSPETVIRAPAGSTFRRRDGGDLTGTYTKESNGTAIDVSNKADSAAVSVASGGTLATYIPTVTTTVDACLIVMALAAQPGSGTGDFDTYTNASLTSITERYDFTIAGCLGMATGIKQTFGATGVTTARNNGAQTVYGPCGITIALRPEAPGVPPVYVAAGVTQTRTTNGTMTVAWPVTGVPATEVAEGDYALLIAEFLETDTLVLSTAEGFTELPTNSPALGTYGGTGGSRIRIWECRAFRPSMTSPQITYTAVGVPAHVQATIFTFRGCAVADAIGWAGK